MADTAIETTTDRVAACGLPFGPFVRPTGERADDFFDPDRYPSAEEDGERWDGLG